MIRVDATLLLGLRKPFLVQSLLGEKLPLVMTIDCVDPLESSRCCYGDVEVPIPMGRIKIASRIACGGSVSD